MLDSRFRNLACTVALVAGCSVLNDFDDVGTIKNAGGSAGTGGSDAGAEQGGTENTAAGSSNLPEAGQGGTMVTPEGGAAGGGGTPPVEMGGEGGGGTVPSLPGLIVVAGTDTDAGNVNVLSVLSPQTGKELSRETLTVPMFAHDGIRDLWYVASVNGDKVELVMRSYDRGTKAWEDQGTGIVIPPPADTSANGWVALRQRFAYISKNGNVLELIVIDSTDPSKLTVQTKVALAAGASGLIGSFGNNPGGNVNIVRTNTNCVAGVTCDLTLSRVQIKAIGMLAEEMPNGTVATIPNPNGKGTWGANTLDIQDVVITPNATGTQATLLQINPATRAPNVGEERVFNVNTTQLRGFTYDSCTGIAFTAELVAKSGNTTIYAVPPPGAGVVGTAQPPQAAQGVFFEPYTKTLIAPFSSGNNHDILAYNLGGTPASPKLNKRGVAQWSPPSDLDPDLLAVATPYPAQCP